MITPALKSKRGGLRHRSLLKSLAQVRLLSSLLFVYCSDIAQTAPVVDLCNQEGEMEGHPECAPERRVAPVHSRRRRGALATSAEENRGNILGMGLSRARGEGEP